MGRKRHRRGVLRDGDRLLDLGLLPARGLHDVADRCPKERHLPVHLSFVIGTGCVFESRALRALFVLDKLLRGMRIPWASPAVSPICSVGS